MPSGRRKTLSPSLRETTPPVHEAFLAIDRTVVDEVLIDDLQLLATLPVGRCLPDDALQPPGAGLFDVPAQLGLLVGVSL